MIYLFDEFELDRSKVELRRNGTTVPVEPQVFALLLLLAENRERLVSRDEVIEKVWDGRIISESALDSRIKSARRALGDDGKAQRFIRTIHGKGFRFVAELKEAAAARQPSGRGGAVPGACRRRETVDRGAPLPSDRLGRFVFRHRRGAARRVDRRAFAVAVALRSSRGARRFGFGQRRRTPSKSARFSACATACRERSRSPARRSRSWCSWRTRTTPAWSGVIASCRASRTSTPRAARFSRKLVAALELQIPLHEARAAQLMASENLDAWSAYHLGLHHMFRFERHDNAVAGELFTRAIAEDPHFARAHAGLSFVHFQNAFLRYTPNIPAEVRIGSRLCGPRRRARFAGPVRQSHDGAKFLARG